MNQQSLQHSQSKRETIPIEVNRIESREWWLWVFAVAITLALTLGIISFTVPGFNREGNASDWGDLREWVRGLAALVLLFDLYAIHQHRQLQRTRRQLAERDQIFQLVSENAADMIALVDSDGRRLYNSPAYQEVLGYSPEELGATSSIEQVHPDDRLRVLNAAEKARGTGQGEGPRHGGVIFVDQKTISPPDIGGFVRAFSSGLKKPGNGIGLIGYFLARP